MRTYSVLSRDASARFFFTSVGWPASPISGWEKERQASVSPIPLIPTLATSTCSGRARSSNCSAIHGRVSARKHLRNGSSRLHLLRKFSYATTQSLTSEAGWTFVRTWLLWENSSVRECGRTRSWPGPKAGCYSNQLQDASPRYCFRYRGSQAWSLGPFGT